jgi:signal transduction histidine kinase
MTPWGRCSLPSVREGALRATHEGQLRAANEATAANSLLSAVLRGSQDLIAAWDADQRLLVFNSAFEQACRNCLGRDVRVGMILGDLIDGRPEECRHCTECWLLSLRDERISELRQFNVGDEDVWHELRYTPMVDGAGKSLGALLIANNVTERRLSEQKQREHEAQLVHAVEHLTHLNRDLQRLTFIASHDLLEPVRNVAWFARLLERNYGSTLDTVGRDYLTSTVNAATSLHKMINDLLVLAKAETRSGKFTLVDSSRACHEAVERLQPAISEAGATVQFSELPVVWADEAQFVQLLGHLELAPEIRTAC